MSEFSRDTTLLIRPLPSGLDDGRHPIRFGGKPRLPEGVDWPKTRHYPDHFFAEITLDRLPRVAGLPDFPGRGTLFVFLPLAFDGLYDCDDANVIYVPEDVRDLPERDPPDDLPNIFESDPCHVHEDGTIDGKGRILMPRAAEVLVHAFEFDPASLHLEDGETKRVLQDRDQRAQEKLFREAQPMPPDPTLPKTPPGVPGFEDVKESIPQAYRKYQFDFVGHHLDWEFIFDFAKDFRNRCAGAKDEGRRFSLRTLLGRSEDFDAQAKRWLDMSRHETGYPSEESRRDFTDMLSEIERHAGDRFAAARRAFGKAAKRAAARYAEPPRETTQLERWDARTIRAAHHVSGLQMFGIGEEIQTVVQDHADQVLLLQIGGEDGLPLRMIGADLMVYLFIPPEDLAAGRFDRVKLTSGMT